MTAKRVLVVDDEPNVTMTLAASLKKLGDDYIVDTANDGAEALSKMQETQYALLITDYKMPGMNGLDLVHAVRRLAPETQIILMTAYGSAELRAAIDQVKLDGYLDKPFDVAQVRELVERATNGLTTTRRILVMEDDDDLRRIFSKALRRAGYEVDTAATVQDARELIAQQDFAVFLCDIRMGGERGTDLLREQSDELSQKGTQIIMVSAESQYRAITEEMGAEFFMEKPIAVGPLVTLVDRIITARQG